MGQGYSKNTGNGRNSKSFRGGSNPHIGASRSQSGGKDYGFSKPTRQPRRSSGPTLGEIIFGPGPKSTSHGGSKKNRNKGKGSR